MDEAADTRVDRLLDAIELIKVEQRAEAVQLLWVLVIVLLYVMLLAYFTPR